MSFKAIHLKPDAYRDREIAADPGHPPRWRVTWSEGPRTIDVQTLKGEARASVYPIALRDGEEMQFPLAGREHFIVAAEGSLEILDPNDDRRLVLEARETYRVTRDTTQEYLNVRAAGRAEKSLCVWVVVHVSA